MAGERALPGLGLRAYWTLGSNGWDAQHDPDTRTVSILCQAAVISRTTNLPATPPDGAIYIVPTGQANANKIAARDAGAWVYIDPKEGFLVHVNDTDEFVKWTGAAWEPLSTGGTAPTALGINTRTANYVLTLADASNYVRMDVATANTLTVPPNSAVAFPIGTSIPVRQAGAGKTTIVEGAGVVINRPETLKFRKQHSGAALIKIAVDTWDLVGDMELLP